MKFTKIITLLLALALAAFATGCSNAPKGKQAEPSANKDTNILGIVHIKPQSFAVSSPNSGVVRTSELTARRDFSGTQTSLLWGLISIEDY